MLDRSGRRGLTYRLAVADGLSSAVLVLVPVGVVEVVDSMVWSSRNGSRVKVWREGFSVELKSREVGFDIELVVVADPDARPMLGLWPRSVCEEEEDLGVDVDARSASDPCDSVECRFR
jgi:hypothetical protein